MRMTGVQSLDRGLEILRQLSREEGLSASALAERMGIHQTSVSRMLRSLQKSGLVRKPDFHRFSLDIGVLSLFGNLLNRFPLVKQAATVCNRIRMETGLCAAVAMLQDNQLLYLARADENASIRIIDGSSFPVHRSSLGLALCLAGDREAAHEIIKQSMLLYGEYEYNLRQILDLAEGSHEKHRFLHLENFAGNQVNASMVFDSEFGKAALAVFSRSQTASPEECRNFLLEGIHELYMLK